MKYSVATKKQQLSYPLILTHLAETFSPIGGQENVWSAQTLQNLSKALSNGVKLIKQPGMIEAFEELAKEVNRQAQELLPFDPFESSADGITAVVVPEKTTNIRSSPGWSVTKTPNNGVEAIFSSDRVNVPERSPPEWSVTKKTLDNSVQEIYTNNITGEKIVSQYSEAPGISSTTHQYSDGGVNSASLSSTRACFRG